VVVGAPLLALLPPLATMPLLVVSAVRQDAHMQTYTRAHTLPADRTAGYAVREQLPMPDKPPYTAHLGNLSFEVTEADVRDFLDGCEVTSVRIVEDKMDRRPKGFGYVEFGTVDGLKKALTLSETQFQGRNIRISVADPRKS
jgi:RNA recognition motif-containing protein